MPDEPQIVHRAEQPYLAIRTTVSMAKLATDVPPLHAELSGWLGQRAIAPAGPPFWRYAEFQAGDLVEVEVGVPVPSAEPGAGDERVRPGVLPAGRYATSVHTGHPTGLGAATAALLDWAERTGVAWEVTEDATSSCWAARLEIYLTDPAEEPDLSRWQTELAIKLAG
jgi:effector-binding domain-containing protein